MSRDRSVKNGLGSLLGLLVLCLPLAVQAEERIEYPPVPAAPVISEIRFAGNKTTRPEIFHQEMLVKVGDPALPDLIERSRQAIMDLGLFKSVTADLLSEGERTVLLITVKEKYYIFPIPKLNRDADNNITLGAQLRMDNLAGLNQRLKLTYETEKSDTSDSDSKTSRLEYSYPRINGSPYAVDVNVSRTSTPTEDSSSGTLVSYESESSYAGVNVSRWVVQESPGIGWRSGSGLVWQKQLYNVYSGAPQDLREGRGVGITALIEYTNVHDYLYSRSGHVYGYSGVFGAPFLGSDNDYTLHLLYFRGFFPMFDRPHETLDVQFRLGLSSDPLFGGTSYGLGSSSTLRGYPAGIITGNAYVLANLEYFTPFGSYYPLRGGVFVDVGNAYPGNSEINLSDLKSTVGIGLRLKLKSFVKIDLRVDYAYAVDTGETKVYAGTKETF